MFTQPRNMLAGRTESTDPLILLKIPTDLGSNGKVTTYIIAFVEDTKVSCSRARRGWVYL